MDPRLNAHDTAHTGRALHGSGGAASAVATKQTEPAPHRSRRPQCSSAGLAVRAAESPPVRQNQYRDRCPLWINGPPPPDSWRSRRRAIYPQLRQRRPSNAKREVIPAPRPGDELQQINAVLDRHLHWLMSRFRSTDDSVTPGWMGSGMVNSVGEFALHRPPAFQPPAVADDPAMPAPRRPTAIDDPGAGVDRQTGNRTGLCSLLRCLLSGCWRVVDSVHAFGLGRRRRRRRPA